MLGIDLILNTTFLMDILSLWAYLNTDVDGILYMMESDDDVV